MVSADGHEGWRAVRIQFCKGCDRQPLEGEWQEKNRPPFGTPGLLPVQVLGRSRCEIGVFFFVAISGFPIGDGRASR